MQWKPHATVACVIEKNGKYLCVEEISSGLQVVNQPAGHLEPGETLVEAAQREVLEETAWHVEITDFLGLYVYVAPSNGVTYHRHCFVAEAIELTDRPLDSGILRSLWLSYEELIERTEQLRSPMVLRCIEDYRKGRRLPLDYVQYETSYSQHQT